jgi:hypothetical protein
MRPGWQPVSSRARPPAPPVPSAARRFPERGLAGTLTFALVTTVTCCPVTGVVAMLHALRAMDRARCGDEAGRTTAAAQARLWAWITVVLGLVFYAVVALLFIVVGVSRS